MSSLPRDVPAVLLSVCEALAASYLPVPLAYLPPVFMCMQTSPLQFRAAWVATTGDGGVPPRTSLSELPPPLLAAGGGSPTRDLATTLAAVSRLPRAGVRPQKEPVPSLAGGEGPPLTVAAYGGLARHPALAHDEAHPTPRSAAGQLLRHAQCVALSLSPRSLVLSAYSDAGATRLHLVAAFTVPPAASAALVDAVAAALVHVWPALASVRGPCCSLAAVDEDVRCSHHLLVPCEEDTPDDVLAALREVASELGGARRLSIALTHSCYVRVCAEWGAGAGACTRDECRCTVRSCARR